MGAGTGSARCTRKGRTLGLIKLSYSETNNLSLRPDSTPPRGAASDQPRSPGARAPALLTSHPAPRLGLARAPGTPHAGASCLTSHSRSPLGRWVLQGARCPSTRPAPAARGTPETRTKRLGGGSGQGRLQSPQGRPGAGAEPPGQTTPHNPQDRRPGRPDRLALPWHQGGILELGGAGPAVGPAGRPQNQHP